MRIDVWSDIACPWCYVGKRRLEAARSQAGVEVEVVWRAFELDPSMPPRLDATQGSYAERLARKYGTSTAQAEAMIERMTRVAAAEGLDFRFDRIQPGNTFDAHRLLHLAHGHGQQDALKERLLAAYFTEGEPIGDREALARLAREAKLPGEEVDRVLGSDAYAEAVRRDEAEARALGVSGVPFFVFAGRFAVSGAQPAELLARVLEQAGRVALEDGAACGPDGCEVGIGA